MGSKDLVRRAARIAGWAARGGYSLSRRLPGAQVVEGCLRPVEPDASGQPWHRMPDGDDAATITPNPRAGMAELLSRSTALDPDGARDHLYALILRQLTPDEARILAVLSDGSSFPSIDVAQRNGFGTVGRAVLRNASTVGKVAGVSLPDHVPAYVTRLVTLGLADIGDAEPALDAQYDILQADETVLAARRSVRRARFVRRTIRISALGLRFWQACDPGRA